ncbi:MAG TPA: alanine racemase [Acidobacteriota bacterium]|nr:alanine racemase [Acidobacteriota bacterium]
MKVSDLRTPALLIDLKKFQRNCRRMVRRARKLGVRLRPHVKSHKTIEGGRIQLGRDLEGITVSTLAEARYFSDAGFEDILYAFPLTPDKLPEVLQLTRRCREFYVLIDHPEMANHVERFARRHEETISCYLKVDSGYRRAGVDPRSQSAVQLASRLAESRWVRLAGVLTHAGQAYSSRTAAEAAAAAEQERRVMAEFGERLGNSGIKVAVSVGSTPTACQVESLSGVDEMRPGNYVFFDKFQADIGNCRAEDCSATVLTRVAGVYPDRNEIIVDAGALALSKDPGAVHLQEGPPGYGSVIGRPGMEVAGLSQEHGLVRCASGAGIGQVGIGDLLEILPNHSCLTAALFPAYAVREKEKVVDRWIPVRGW